MPLRVSVALCTYNGERHLPALLASLAAQDRPPDEVVVADDDSTDTTRAVVAAWGSTVPFTVRVIHDGRRLGSSANFGRALAATTGDVVALADQDDVWLPGKLAALAAALDARPDAGLVFSDATCVGDDLRDLGYTAFQAVGFDDAARRALAAGGARAFRHLLRRPVVTGATMAVRSAYRDLVLPFPGLVTGGTQSGLIHDRWIAVLVAAAAPVVWLDEPLVRYRQHPGQQLGLAAPTVARAATATERRAALLALAAEADVVAARLREAASRWPAVRHAQADATAAARHWRARATLPASRLARLPAVAREAARYRRFSNGWKAVALDLARRADDIRDSPGWPNRGA